MRRLAGPRRLLVNDLAYFMQCAISMSVREKIIRPTTKSVRQVSVVTADSQVSFNPRVWKYCTSVWTEAGQNNPFPNIPIVSTVLGGGSPSLLWFPALGLESAHDAAYNTANSCAVSFAVTCREISSYPSSRCHLSCLPSLLGSLDETGFTGYMSCSRCDGAMFTSPA